MLVDRLHSEELSRLVTVSLCHRFPYPEKVHYSAINNGLRKASGVHRLNEVLKKNVLSDQCF